MEYQVAYDIQQVTYPGWWIFVVGLVFFFVGLIILLFSDTKALDSIVESSKKQRIWMPILSIIFGSLWVGAGVINYSNFADLRNAAQNGSSEVVEGQVREFVPMPYEGHANETFVVNGKYFAYSDYDETKGFNHTQSHGGPMKEGLQVRITHVDGSIVKLEIGKQ
jgi:hypothetical protein